MTRKLYVTKKELYANDTLQQNTVQKYYKKSIGGE